MAGEISGFLINRVAAAAYGLRTGSPVWIVAEEENPDAIKWFSDRGSAESFAAARRREGFDPAMFGPFQTPDESEGSGMREIARVTVEYVDGGTQVFTPRDCEAIFLTLSAIDRFLLPYYTYVRGAAATAELREQILSGTAPFCCKDPMSILPGMGDS